MLKLPILINLIHNGLLLILLYLCFKEVNTTNRFDHMGIGISIVETRIILLTHAI